MILIRRAESAEFLNTVTFWTLHVDLLGLQSPISTYKQHLIQTARTPRMLEVVLHQNQLIREVTFHSSASLKMDSSSRRAPLFVRRCMHDAVCLMYRRCQITRLFLGGDKMPRMPC